VELRLGGCYSIPRWCSLAKTANSRRLDAEFPVDIAEMAFHSFFADGEMAVNLAVAGILLVRTYHEE
jgi:hypothetical protein